MLGVGVSHKTEVTSGKVGRGTSNPKGQTEQLKNNETLCGLAENVHRKLEGVVEGNEGLARFMAQCTSFLSFFFLYLTICAVI